MTYRPAFFLLHILLVFITGCSSGRERLYYIAPSLIPGTTREMKSPGFWIKNNPSADKALLSLEEVRSFNQKTEKDLGLIRDISGFGSTYPGADLRAELNKTLDFLSGRRLYRHGNKTAGRDFYRDMKEYMGVDKIPGEIKTRFGFTCRYADQRILPRIGGLYENKGDIDFDELQNSSFDPGTPLVVLHETQDGKWLYALSRDSAGWLEKDLVCLCDHQELSGYLANPVFGVVISPKADIFLDARLTDFYEYTRMGSRFPVSGDLGPVTEVIIPFRGDDGRFSERKAYMNKDDIIAGFLPYTPRNIIKQSFKLINAPYGWGGLHGEQDCSGFLQEVYATVGIFLPRNSSAQAEVGVLLGKFDDKTTDSEKTKVLSERAAGGVTLLRLDNHIMLFLGMVEGRPYVIHDTWGFRQRVRHKDYSRIINRVAVTGLDLGRGSSRSSLLKRMVSARNIAAGKGQPLVENILGDDK